jgi:hypothetical protein
LCHQGFLWKTINQIGDLAIEFASSRFDGQIVIGSSSKYDKPISELFAGVPRTGSAVDFSGAVMRKIYMTKGNLYLERRGTKSGNCCSTLACKKTAIL